MTDWQKYRRKSKVVWTADGQMPEIEPYTKVKHELLESYLSDWVETIIGNRSYTPNPKVTIVDGFCGGGIYKDGEDVWEGSPIRIIRAIENGWKAVKERKPYQNLDIAYLFVDRRQEHTESLEQEIRKHGYAYLLENKKCIVRTGYFEDQLNECLEWVKDRGGHSFFFLDPFGSVDLPGMARAILSLKGTEVLLNHMHNDAFVRPIVKAFKENRGWQYLDEYNLRKYYSFFAEYDNLPNLERQTLAHNAALQLYRERSNPRFAWTFAFMKNRDSVYYYLVHLSNHPTAISVMRRNLWMYNNLDYQFHYGVFGLGYRTIEDFEKNFQLLNIEDRNRKICQEKLVEQLDRFIFNSNSFSFKKIYEGTIDHHPATREDYMSVIHQGIIDGEWEMERDGKIACSSRLTNRDIIRPAKAKQLVLFPGKVSGRIPPKRKVNVANAAQDKSNFFGKSRAHNTSSKEKP